MSTRIAIDIAEPRRAYRGPAILSAGHRPFFLAAGIWAAAGLALWVAALAGLVPLSASWHGHEMLFGFAVAAIAGFLMAAVPKWTNGETILGTRLSLLLALWLLGRVAMITGTATWLDLLFLPTFAGSSLGTSSARGTSGTTRSQACFSALPRSTRPTISMTRFSRYTRRHI